MRLTFTVDAKLLQELGERLVGRPHIALAELIKNAYDADARKVELTFRPGEIRIVDNGHGMSEGTFTGRWMRIGTTEKVREQTSPTFGRPLTGSKGVGRLAVQLLSNTFQVESVALADPSRMLSQGSHELAEGIRASIHWPDSELYDELTSVGVEFDRISEVEPFVDDSPHGTRIVLSDLTTDWDAQAFANLAREIWALQPPFHHTTGDPRAFQVVLITPYAEVQESFDAQMSALMSIHTALVEGRLLAPTEAPPRGATRIALPDREMSMDEDGVLRSDDRTVASGREIGVTRQMLVEVDLKGVVERFVAEISNCQIDALDFEIRVFDLRYRQGAGIKVADARSYLNVFGGVHIYDNDFRLPYYGPDADWLKLELDHARRLSNSRLVPDELNVRDGMQDLPSNKRVFGAVRISTAAERAAAERTGRRASDALSIQITRDRLVDNASFGQLSRAVRLSLDLYALTRAKSKTRGVIRRRGGVRPDSDTAIRRASEVIEALREELPQTQYEALRESIDTVADDMQQRQQESRAYASLLGALATAGMTSLAYEHEVARQRKQVARVASRLRRIAKTASPEVGDALIAEAKKLSEWRVRSEHIRSLFLPLLDEENRSVIERYNVKSVVDDVVTSLKVLARGTKVETADIPEDLLFPPGTYAAWTAMFQNLLNNAFRATLERKPALVEISAELRNGSARVTVQDNGVGIDPADGERMFLPFERGIENTAKAEVLGLSGSGLGLTIVRMIADELHVNARFVAPRGQWNAAVQVDWKV